MNIWTVLKSLFDEKLPDSCKCFSSLKYECISKKDYLYITNVWNTL